MDNFTKQGKILRAIKDSGRNGIENYKLANIALKYTGIISELRKDGYVIIAERDRLPNGRYTNTWRYRLSSKKNAPVNRTREGQEVVRELMIAKSKGRYACYRYVNHRLKELGVI